MVTAERGVNAVVGRGEITDKAWEQIAPLLPENGRRGGQWEDHRKIYKRYPLEAEDRSSVAGFTSPLRPLANVL